MAGKKNRKLFKVAKELNLASGTLTDELLSRGYKVEKGQMTPITDAMYEELLKNFAPELWAKRTEEIANKEAEELERKTQEVRHADLQKILDTGNEKAPSKPAPQVRKMDEESQRTLVQSISGSSSNMTQQATAIDSEEETSAATLDQDSPEEKGKTTGKTLSRKTAPSVRKTPDGFQPEAFSEEVAPDAEIKPGTEEPSRTRKKRSRSASMSVRGAVSNDDILVFTPPAPVRNVAEKVESGTSKSEKAGTTEAEKTTSKKKRKRKRRTVKTEIQEDLITTKPVKKTPASEGPKSRSKRRDRKKKKKVDIKEVQASIKQTMAAMEDHGRKKKKRRVAQDVGVVDEETRLLQVTEFVSTTDLASLIDVPVNDLIRECLMLGLRVTINHRLERDTIQLLAEEHGYQLEFIDKVSEEELIEEDIEEEDESKLVPVAPVVTVMGHVDHGKTSLLDFIRSAHVVDGEAGGITQHIAAYEVDHKGKKITFLDTPGHAAFTAMRARGANITDIVVLVVAADDQVMPQTIEAIDHSKAANVPMVIAINKIDKPGADADKVRRQLSEQNVIVEEYGGDVLASEISAKTGEGIEDLLDKILLTAEMLELKANPDTTARGVVIESRLDKGRGTVCTILIQKGTLSVGDVFVAGPYLGRVRAMYDERGARKKKAGPSEPVGITGFEAAPHVGDKVVAYKDEREAKEIATKRQLQQREQEMRLREGFRGTLLQTIEGHNKRLLYLIIKGDVDGSVEAIADALMRLSTNEVEVNIIHRSVGSITESDVLLASASNAMIIGFNVHPNPNAREMAQREDVEFRTYKVIYELIEDVKKILTGMYRREFTMEVAGAAEVRNTFKISRIGVIAGCMVVSGKILKSNRVRILRDGTEIYTGELESLKRFKDDTKEVVQGFECGIKVANYNDLKVGDLIESLVEVEVEREIEMEA